MRRDDGDTNVRALFSLAVRMAQLIKLHEDPGGKYPPFEVELRRRLWWHICGLESRAAEEGVARQTSIMEDRPVKIAGNLNDLDLQPEMSEWPATRAGVADTTFVVLRSEVVALAHRLWAIKKKFRLEGRVEETAAMQQEQQAALDAFRAKITTDVLAFCDPSRRFDWLLLHFFEAMSVRAPKLLLYPACTESETNSSSHLTFARSKKQIKLQTIITHSTSASQPPPSPRARTTLLHSSVHLISATRAIAQSPRVADWSWYFRGYMQWHAVGTVIAELGRSRNESFRRQAWAVLDPVLRDWERVFEGKRGEESWEYVNGLILRAKGQRDGGAGAVGEGGGGAAEGGEVGAAKGPGESDWPLHAAAPQDTEVPSNNTYTVHSTPHTTTTTTVPFATGCAPPLSGSQHTTLSPDLSFPSAPLPADPTLGLGIDDFDTLGEIDFSAFDAVFGGEWDSSPDVWIDEAGVGVEGISGGMWG